jgi:hypothetical protein
MKTQTLSNDDLVKLAVTKARTERAAGKKMSTEDKRQILAQLENKSARTVKKVLLELAPPDSIPPESSRKVSGALTEIRVFIDENLRADLEKLKSIMSHKNPHMGYAELLRELADLAIKRLQPKRVSPPTSPVAGNRHIPNQIKRAVWKRDKGHCAFTDAKTGRQCESRYQLQIHHVFPFAKGGTSSEGNLKLFCRAHNQHQAIKDFGDVKMRRVTD